MSEKRHLGTITILIKDRQMHSVDVQKILTDHGHKIMARLGVKGITDDLDKLYGIVAKASIMTD